MTLKEACEQAHQIAERLQAEIEAGRVADAEAHRLTFETSIRCGHDEQDYITIAEFDFQVCRDCALQIVWGLLDNHDDKVNGE